VLMSAKERGNRQACATARMVAKLSLKQPWHTKY